MRSRVLLVLSSLWIAAFALAGCEGEDSHAAEATRCSPGCSGDQRCEDGVCVSPGTDAGGTDAQVEDLGSPDGGTPPADGGTPPADSGTPSPDGGDEPDLGPSCDGDEDCLATQTCNQRTHQCELICRPCSAGVSCGPDQHCDHRLGDAGCCLPNCDGDTSCAATQYCDAVTHECAEGCRVGSCDEGHYCDLETHACAAGCLAHDDCPNGTICQVAERSCVPGCLTDGGCPAGQRCDTELFACTTGCVADGNCAVGERCHRAEHLCRPTCGRALDCPEGLECLVATGLCAADPARCDAPAAPACAAARRCNPLTGTCLEAGGSSCQGVADCAAGEACVPELATPEDEAATAVCRAELGDAAPAAACVADDDCASGLCLHDGSCFSPCAEVADCPVGLRCWPVSFYLGAGPDPLTTADDLLLPLTGCRTPPTPCARGSECQGQEQVCRPWLDPDRELLDTACLPGTGGAGPPGSHCLVDAECRTGHCTADHLCLAVCETQADCGAGQLCGTVTLALDGVRGPVPACVPDPGSGAPCTAHDGCATAGEACHPEKGEDGSLALACRPAPGPGAPSARCTRDWDCASGLCLARGFCFGACVGEGPCAEGQQCQEQNLGIDGLAGGGSSTTCLTLEVPCLRDADCPRADHACIPAPSFSDPTVIELLCRPQVGLDAGGNGCAADGECRSGLCVKESGAALGLCYAACGSDDDCDDGEVCDPAGYRLPLGEGQSAPIPACGPSRGSLTPCTGSLDCRDGEVCTAQVDASGAALETVCIVPLVEANPWICTTNEQCPTGVCVASEFFGTCLSLCATDAECALPDDIFPMVCVPTPLTIDGVEGTVGQCGLGEFGGF